MSVSNDSGKVRVRKIGTSTGADAGVSSAEALALGSISGTGDAAGAAAFVVKCSISLHLLFILSFFVSCSEDWDRGATLRRMRTEYAWPGDKPDNSNLPGATCAEGSSFFQVLA